MYSHPTLSLSSVAFKNRRQTQQTLSSTEYFTYSCRGAIQNTLHHIPRDSRTEVLVPAFHCPTVIDPVIFSKYKPVFYGINEKLEIELDDLEQRITEETRAIVIVNYFGFSANFDAVKALCHKRSIFIIEDCAHSFLHTNPLRLSGGRGDASVYSFKKLIPCHVGGGISIKSCTTSSPSTLPVTPRTYATALLKIFIGEILDDLSSRNRLVRAILAIRSQLKSSPLQQEGEHEPRITAFEYPYIEELERSRMPLLAREVLHQHNLESVARIRRDNYLSILKIIKDHKMLKPVFNHLPEHIVPWALPVTIEDREKFDIRLRKLGVPVFTFGETQHSLLLGSSDKSSAEKNNIDMAIKLSKTLLCIPVHQQLSKDDITRWESAFAKLASIS